MSDVERNVEYTDEFFGAKEAILAGVSEQCRECRKPRREARNLAFKVIAGEISREEAGQSLVADIGQHCLLGPAYTGSGCRPQPSYECGYGGRELTDEERLEVALSTGEEISLDLLSPEARVEIVLRDFSKSDTSIQS